ncbi:Uncharacterised protein [Nocardia brasiliensis]|nr:DUF4185 domain-containing protein [Nocardia brasiliensis]SUB55038.1 Uncharacterised protein [Nocardia brasiliensis]
MTAMAPVAENQATSIASGMSGEWGFIHPWSTATDLYFTLSAWDTYNVYLMHAELKPAR